MDLHFLRKFPFTIFQLPAFLSWGLSCLRGLFKRLTSFSYSLAIFLFLSDSHRQVGPFSMCVVVFENSFVVKHVVGICLDAPFSKFDQGIVLPDMTRFGFGDMFRDYKVYTVNYTFLFHPSCRV
eukprot:TCONS_00033975-protein